MKKKNQPKTIIVGGLHADDFEWAYRKHETLGYMLTGFVLDIDGYHWRAVYVKAEKLEKALKNSPFQSKNDDFHVAVAKTLDETCKLLEAGFEYVCDINNTKILRKRKQKIKIKRER